MIIHLVFDGLAWLSAWLMARWIARRQYLRGRLRSPSTDPGYFIALGLSAIVGALLAGSGNMNLVSGKSVTLLPER
jgi:hypothetical protein